MVKRTRSNTSLRTKSKIQRIELNIDCLPDDILFIIFRTFPTAFLHSVISKVCHRWNRICQQPLLWRDLKLNDGELNSEEACELLKTAGLHLHHLKVSSRRDCDTILSQVSKSNKNLCKLHLEHCSGTRNRKSLASKPVLDLVRRLHFLKIFHFHDTNFCSTKFFTIFGKKDMWNMRRKKAAALGKIGSQLGPVTYCGPLTYRQLQVWLKQTDTESCCVSLTFKGRKFSMQKTLAILESTKFKPNSFVKNFSRFIE